MKHEDLVDYIILAIRRTTPYTNKEQGYIYAVGFLASYLASLSQEDPFILRRFIRHCEEQADLKPESKQPNR